MNRVTVSTLETGYSTAVELEEATNALQLSGVVEECRNMTEGTKGSKDASWLENSTIDCSFL